MSTEAKLPILDLGDENRLIKGTFIKCTDGHWTDRDGIALQPDLRALVLATTRALQRWENKLPVETVMRSSDGTLPDPDTLNAGIPRSQWEIGLDGQPREPWSRQFVAYLLDPDRAALLTYANSTIGSRIAVCDLEDKIRWKRALSGQDVLPLVKFESKVLKTRFGTKQRPEFAIVSWHRFGGAGATLQIADQGASTLKTVAPIDLAAEMRDAITY
jgi:hypothetical protein